MAQKLILPINNCRLKIGRNSDAFTKYCERKIGGTATHSIGFSLADASLNSGVNVWASGNGTVLELGTDVNFGNVIVIKYPACTLRSGAVRDIIIRYYDLGSRNVSKGQTVNKDIKIGTTGRSGRFCPDGFGRVRIELDTDTAYPAYSPSVLSGWTQGIIKKGTASTMLDMNQVLYMLSALLQTIKLSNLELLWYGRIHRQDVNINGLLNRK